MKKILIVLTCFLLPSALTASDEFGEIGFELNEEESAAHAQFTADVAAQAASEYPMAPQFYGNFYYQQPLYFMQPMPQQQHAPQYAPHTPAMAPQQFGGAPYYPPYFPQPTQQFDAQTPQVQPHQRPHALLQTAAASTLPQPSAVPVAMAASALGGAGSGSKPAVDFDYSTATPARQTAHWMRKVEWETRKTHEKGGDKNQDYGICSFPDCKNKTMIRRNNLKRHIRRHTDDMQHFCPKCQKGFIRNVDCEKHEATCKGPATTSSGSGGSTVPKKRGAKKRVTKIPAVAPASAKAGDTAAPMDLSTDHPAAQQILVPPYDLGVGSYAPYTDSQSSMGEQPSTTYSEYSDEQEWSAFDTSGAELPLSPVHHMSPLRKSGLGTDSSGLEFPGLEVAVQDTSTEYSLPELPASAQLASAQLELTDEQSTEINRIVTQCDKTDQPLAQPQYVQQPAAQQGAGSGSGTSAASESNTLSPYEASLLFVTERESLDPAILKELLSVLSVAGQHNHNNKMKPRNALINTLIEKHNKKPICQKCSATFTDWDARIEHRTQGCDKQYAACPYKRCNGRRFARLKTHITVSHKGEPRPDQDITADRIAVDKTIPVAMAASALGGAGSGSKPVDDFDYSTDGDQQMTAASKAPLLAQAAVAKARSMAAVMAGAGTKRPRTLGMPTADTSAERPAKLRRLDKKTDAASAATEAQKDKDDQQHDTDKD